MRKPGWYWVRSGADEAWEVAEWNGGTWELTGTDHDWPEYMIKVVGPRIPTPDEPWQSVPGLDGDETKALERFSETALDDGTYDIGQDMIRRLADKGAVRHLSAGRYQLTQAGQAMLAAAPNTKEPSHDNQ